MTPKEAINFFKSYKFVGSRDCGKSQMLQDVIKADIKAIAYAKAISALEKQIPKKPDYEGDGFDEDGYLIYDTWICPNCEHKYEVDYDDYDFCPNCGQALDRSDKNDL